MTQRSSTTLNVTNNFINGHVRTSQICMNIPQSHIDGGIQHNLKTGVDGFKIEGDQSQEIKEDHFGVVSKKNKLSTLQSYVSLGFMQMVAWVSTPLMAIAADDAAAAPETIPWGLITNGKKIP